VIASATVTACMYRRKLIGFLWQFPDGRATYRKCKHKEPDLSQGIAGWVKEFNSASPGMTYEERFGRSGD